MPAKRYFEFSEGTSNKFWEVWCDGTEVFTRYGKIGAAGQLTVKNASSTGAAREIHDKLVREKTGKGYAEKGAKAAKAEPSKSTKSATKGAKAAKVAKAAPEPIVVEVPKGALRLEMIEGTSSKFWQILLDGKAFTVTYGRIGTAGTTEKKKFNDEWSARGERDKLLEQKKRKGYQLVLTGRRPKTETKVAQNPQLEAQILKDPSSDDGFMVYADWLQEQGDIRGELATLQARLAKHPKDKKLQNAENKLVWEHRAHFFGPIAVYWPEDQKSDRAIEPTWRQGWIDTLAIGAISSWAATDGVPQVDSAAELIRLLPKVASARFVRELTITRPVAESEYHFASSIAELVKVIPELPALRRLTIGRFSSGENELSWSYMGKVDPLWPAAKHLEYLKLRAGEMSLGKINLPEVREFRIETGGLAKKSFASILAASMPKLETLSLWFGMKEYGCGVDAADTAPILDCKKFPKLVHLGLKNAQWGNELAPLLVKAKILRQLETLDLSMSHLTTKGLQVFVQHKDAFAHLRELDLSRCLLDNNAQKLAKTLAKSVNLDRQRDPNDYERDTPGAEEDENKGYRYAAVGE